jgi:DNA-binding transcriptional ArsR family regulator
MIERPDQLKALGHPLRLRVLEALGENGEELTNRELSQRLGVDPGHLHFHVRMLLNAGLIELANGGHGREKPYRAVAARVRVAPELITTRDANDARAAMLDEVQHGWNAFAEAGQFRAAQITARVTLEDVRELVQWLTDELDKRERPDNEPLVITLFAHPRSAEAPRS